MKMGNPLVSIIVRTKDRPKLLNRALQSIAGQDYRPVEVVLVNDGEALSELDSIQESLQDIRLKYIDNKGRGRTVAANLGLKHSDGNFICFLDDDDILYKDHVSTLVYFLKDSDYKVAYTESYFVHVEYDPVNKKIIQTQKYPAQTMDFSREALLFYNYIPFMCLMFEKDIFESVGGFDEEFESCEDWDLTIRASAKYPFYHIKRFTSEYNIWSRDLQSIQRDEELLTYRKKIYQKHLRGFSPDVIATFIFNGYWANIKFMEDRISNLESDLTKKEEDLQIVQIVQNEKERLSEEKERLSVEKERLSEEKDELELRIAELENYMRTRTIKVPAKLKSILKSLLKRKDQE